MSDSGSLAGKVLGGYEVLCELGRGGMGVVYKAQDKGSGRVVTLKILAPRFGEDPAFIERFEPEVQAAAQLDHPNIVTVHGVGRQGDACYIAREHIDGRTVAALEQEQGPFDAAQALGIVRQVASALAEAHRHGIVHRDIKPHNIMLDKNGHVKVLDFVMAKLRQGTTGKTGSMGTPLYMSPEQAQDQPVDGRSDIFSLGIMLYEMLAGRPPFQADAPAALAYQIVYKPLPELPEDAAPLPPGAAELLHKMTAKSPDERYESADALGEAIDALLGDA